MKLGQPESLRMLNHHDRGIGDIDTNLNHGGCNQNADFAFLEQLHGHLFGFGIHSAMENRDAKIGENLLTQLAIHFHGSFEFVLFVFFDHGINHISLVSGGNLLAYEFPDFVGTLVADSPGYDGRPPGRHFIEHAEVEVAVNREGKGARNWSRSHHHDVGLCLGSPACGTLAHQLETLQHSEAVLLIHNHQTEFREFDFLFDQRMRADDQLRVALHDVAPNLAFAAVFERAGQQHNAIA